MSSRPAVAHTESDTAFAVGLLSAGTCDVCQQPVDGGRCPNTVCTLPDREFSHVLTISEDPGPPSRARLLLGFLDVRLQLRGA